MSSALYIGLMTGTSLDGVDAVLAEFTGPAPRLVAHHSMPLPDGLRRSLLQLTAASHDEIALLMDCDRQLGHLYAETVQALLHKSATPPEAVRAIGSHGQTLRHRPAGQPAWTLQIGDPATLAVETGIDVVADFRRQDIAAGGQGAPLAPGFHAAAFRAADEDRVILNLGGIANITVLPRDGQLLGFDTGPANSLMDLWIGECRQQRFDHNGDWARSGTADLALVDDWIRQTPWLRDPPPKSTGRETFGTAWLAQQRNRLSALAAADAQASLAEFSALTISAAIRQHAPAGSHVYACGGGARNGYLLERIAARLPGCRISATTALGVAPEWVEATAFAWLARQRVEGLPGNRPDVTGASRALVLGALYRAR